MSATSFDKLIKAIITPGDFSNWLGATFDSVGPGTAVLRAIVRKDMLNAIGVCHGGIIFSLADTAVAAAAHTRERVSMTIEGSISFIESIGEGDTLIVSAAESALKNRLGFYNVTIAKNDGTKVAEFRSTVFRTSQEFKPA